MPLKYSNPLKSKTPEEPATKRPSRHLKVEKGDFFISEDKQGLQSLIKATSVDERYVYGVLQKDPHIKSLSTQTEHAAVRLNLGPRPVPGKILGFDTSNLFVKAFEHDRFGTLNFFTRPSQGTMEKLWSGLTNAYDILDGLGISAILDTGIVWEVTSDKHMGKYAGVYVPSKDPEKRPRRIRFCVGNTVLEKASKASWKYVLLHEIGHALHYQTFMHDPQLEVDWMQAYESTVQLSRVEEAECAKFYKSFVKSGASVSNWASGLSEEDVEKLKLILKWISTNKHFSARELSTLNTTDVGDSKGCIQAVWPEGLVVKPNLHPSVTEYACKSYYELIAESFAFHALGMKLPKDITKLVERSIKYAKAHLSSEA